MSAERATTRADCRRGCGGFPDRFFRRDRRSSAEERSSPQYRSARPGQVDSSHLGPVDRRALARQARLHKQRRRTSPGERSAHAGRYLWPPATVAFEVTLSAKDDTVLLTVSDYSTPV